MKKKLILGLFVAVMASVSSLTASVGATPPTTDVTGVITENFVAVPNASVTVLCNGNTETDTTDAFGSYLVTYPSANCPFGSTVKVTAVKDGKSGVASGTVTGITTKLNLAIVNVQIPEFGVVAGTLAGGAAIGLIAFMRRRQQQDLQF